MRRVFILALLIGAMKLIAPLGTGGYGSQALLAFGLLILAAYAAGELAHVVHVPKLLGYIVAGVAFGPSALNFVNTSAVSDLEPVSSLAIALIAFLAGSELRWSDLRARGATIGKILGSELSISFIAITTFLIVLRDHVSFLRGNGPAEVLAFSLVFASIAIVHSPAVTMGLLSETKADGPVARTALGVVLTSDVVVVLLLTGVLALARVLVPPRGADVPALTVSAVAWEVIGAVVVGALIGGFVTVYLRFVRRELFLFAMMVAFFGSEVAGLLHIEPLLTLLTAGFVTENMSSVENGNALEEAMSRAAAPVFVVFFALAGADVALSDIAVLWPLVVPLAIVRGGAIWTGCRLGLRWSKVTEAAGALRRNLWTSMISQAGVAIGLAAVVAQTYPTRGNEIRALFLALVAVDESVGAILFRRALDRSGEIPDTASRAHEPAAEAAAPG